MRLPLLPLLLSPALSWASFLGMDISLEGGELVTSLVVDGCPSRRYPIPFDPGLMDVELEDAWVNSPVQGNRVELPDWAVDTLSEVSGMPLALVVAFPGIPGGGGSLRAEIRDRSGLWSDGIWFDFTAPEWADSVRLTFRGMGSEPGWSGGGYELRMDGGSAVFTGGSDAGRLCVSQFDGWEDLYSFLSRSFSERIADPAPLSVRGAAIEAAAAGADETMMIARLRTILCNSFRLETRGHLSRLLEVDPVVDLMTARIADRMELALALHSILRELGVESELVMGATDPSAIPVPSEWTRPLIMAFLSDGRSVLVDPSAYLTGAFHVPGRSSLVLLYEGADRLHEPVAQGPEDIWRETWIVSPDGAFDLELVTGGSADSLLRHRMAGLEGADASAALALWLMQGGQVVAIDSIASSDLYDLASSARLSASGRLADQPRPGSLLKLPLLSNALREGVVRTWMLPRPAAAAGGGTVLSVDRCSLVDSVGLRSAPVILMDRTE